MADLISAMAVEEVMSQIKGSRLAMAENLVGAKSAIPGLNSKLKPSPAVKRAAKNLPVEVDESSAEAEDDRETVSLHAYLKLAKGEKITPELLEKAEKKAKREGNQAILDRIEKSKRFILRSKAPKTPGRTGGRGFAMYRGIQPSPKVAGKKSQKCVCVGFGYIDYYYLPGDGRTNIESLDRKLSAMFKSNGVGAAVVLNDMVRSKKLSIYLRFDRATKKEKVVVAKIDSSIFNHQAIAFSETFASADFSATRPELMLICANQNIASLPFENFVEAIASGSIDLKNVNRSLYNYLANRKVFEIAAVGSALPSNTSMLQNQLDAAYEEALHCDAHVEVKASLDLTSLAPTRMYKERGSNGDVRFIEADGQKITLSQVDWTLLKALVEQKLQKLLVQNTTWTATVRDHVVVFTLISNQNIKISISSEALVRKLA